MDDIVLIGDNDNEIKLLTQLLVDGVRFAHNSRYPDDYQQQKCGTSQLENVPENCVATFSAVFVVKTADIETEVDSGIENVSRCLL